MSSEIIALGERFVCIKTLDSDHLEDRGFVSPDDGGGGDAFVS